MKQNQIETEVFTIYVGGLVIHDHDEAVIEKAASVWILAPKFAEADFQNFKNILDEKNSSNNNMY